MIMNEILPTTSEIKMKLMEMGRPAIRYLRPAPLTPLKPVSLRWGYERGTPIGRYFIDEFMSAHRNDITGTVLEVKNKLYTDSFGQNVLRGDVLDIDETNRNANIITDLASADCVPSDTYDCFILNEVLQFVYDLKSAIGHAHRILKPGGVLLVTVPCTVPTDRELEHTEYWRFTGNLCRRLFGDEFTPEQVEVETYGNFVTCTAGLSGIAVEELEPDMLNDNSNKFVQGVCVRARKKKF